MPPSCSGTVAVITQFRAIGAHDSVVLQSFPSSISRDTFGAHLHFHRPNGKAYNRVKASKLRGKDEESTTMITVLISDRFIEPVVENRV